MSGAVEFRVEATGVGESLVISIPTSVLGQLAAPAPNSSAQCRRWAEIHGLADYLGVPVSRARYMRSIGLPAKKIGKRLLFDLREVDAWLETR